MATPTVVRIDLPKLRRAFAANYQRWRLKRKLTHREVAERCGLTYMQSPIRWGSGRVLPSTETLVTLAEVLQCRVDSLLRDRR